MNEIIIIHWHDCEVSWIPKTEDSVKFLAKWQESIDCFVIAEIPLQWKQYVKEQTTGSLRTNRMGSITREPRKL